MTHAHGNNSGSAAAAERSEDRVQGKRQFGVWLRRPDAGQATTHHKKVSTEFESVLFAGRMGRPEKGGDADGRGSRVRLEDPAPPKVPEAQRVPGPRATNHAPLAAQQVVFRG